MNGKIVHGAAFCRLQILRSVNILILILACNPDDLLDFLQMFFGDGILVGGVFHAGSTGRTEASWNGHDLRRKSLTGAVFLKSCGTEM